MYLTFMFADTYGPNCSSFSFSRHVFKHLTVNYKHTDPSKKNIFLSVGLGSLCWQASNCASSNCKPNRTQKQNLYIYTPRFNAPKHTEPQVLFMTRLPFHKSSPQGARSQLCKLWTNFCRPIKRWTLQPEMSLQQAKYWASQVHRALHWVQSVCCRRISCI